MLVDNAIEYIDGYITYTVDEYKKTDKSTDTDGNYIPHPLESKTQDDKLKSLDFGLRDACLNSTPVKLIETVGSNATEFRPINDKEYVRVAQYPAIGNNLDIDESLVFAVIYKALYFLWDGYENFATQANSIYANYKDATRDYFLNRGIDVETDPIYFRYSADGTDGSWHDNFTDGDKYISIKQGDGLWSNAIKFVGDDGATGDGGDGGATTFVDLTDTPDTLTADKWLKVNADGTALIETDAPAPPQIDPLDGESDVSGDFSVYPKDMPPYYYFECSGDANIDIAKNADDEYEIDYGKIYTWEIIPAGNNVTLVFDAIGDKTIDSSANVVFVELFYDGIDIYIYDKKVF